MRSVYKILLMCFYFLSPHVLIAQTPFSCSKDAYQVAAPDGSSPSNLYKYNIDTGVRTLIANLSHRINSLGYNIIDNLLWGYVNNASASGDIARIDANGNVTTFVIPNLPNNDFNNGDVINGGYLLLYERDKNGYFVVDINPARTTTYLQLVDPTTGFTLKTGAPYNTTLSQAIHTSDFSYNTLTGMLMGVTDDQGKIVTLNPLTGNVTLISPAATGIPGNTPFGAAFQDSNGNLIVFANDNGKFYQLDPTTNTAKLLSQSNNSDFNDGARCSSAAPLPVSLISFGVKPQNPNAVEVNWITGSETNNKLFIIERSIDLKTFEEVTQVRDVAGNTNGPATKNYRIVDNSPFRGTSYYRLTQVDFNDSKTTYPAKSVIIGRTYGVFPNPLENASFSLELDDPITARIVLLSPEGRLIPFKKSASANQENVTIQPISQLTSGLYLLQVTERGQTRVHRVIVK